MKTPCRLFKDGKAIIAFAVLAVLFLIAPSANAEDNATAAQFAGESVPAPFDLRWGMTCSEIMALGTRNVGIQAPCRDVVNLPKGLRHFKVDFGFNDSGGIIDLQARYRSGDSISSRRLGKALRAALIAKYGRERVLYDTPNGVLLAWLFEDGSRIEIESSLATDSANYSHVWLSYKTRAAINIQKEKDRIENEKKKNKAATRSNNNKKEAKL